MSPKNANKGRMFFFRSSFASALLQQWQAYVCIRFQTGNRHKSKLRLLHHCLKSPPPSVLYSFWGLDKHSMCLQKQVSGFRRKDTHTHTHNYTHSQLIIYPHTEMLTCTPSWLQCHLSMTEVTIIGTDGPECINSKGKERGRNEDIERWMSHILCNTTCFTMLQGLGLDGIGHAGCCCNDTGLQAIIERPQ